MPGSTPSPLSRRNLIVGLALSACASAAAARKTAFKAAGLVPIPEGWGAGQKVDLATAGLKDWSGQVGSLFRMESELGASYVRLHSVTPFSSKGRRPRDVSRDRAFALNFVPEDGRLPKGDSIYAMTSPAADRFNVYFGPARERLVAVFN